MGVVYLETSYLSACVTDRVDAPSIYRRQASVDWWALFRAKYDLVSSAEVVSELSDPAFTRGPDALRLLEDVDLLDIDSEVVGVAEVFVRERVMPGPVAGDAVHVAVSAVHGVDYLLSWNVRHLANPNKVVHLGVVCRRLGLIPPAIVTPDLLWGLP